MLARPPAAAHRAYSVALGLSVFTMVYNVVEGLVSTWLGLRDETLALFGFGIDSFIEVISGVGIAVMVALVAAKEQVGRQLNSAAIRADANCTRVHLQAGVLLVASGLYALTSWPYLDALGSLGLAGFSWREGRESLEKAASGAVCGCGPD